MTAVMIGTNYWVLNVSGTVPVVILRRYIYMKENELIKAAISQSKGCTGSCSFLGSLEGVLLLAS